MKFELIWSLYSRQSLREINIYYSKVASEKTSKKLIQGIIQKAETLKNAQLSGQKEILLESHTNDFRYLLFKNYKIIFSVNNENSTILIYDIFDCRRNPELLEKLPE